MRQRRKVSDESKKILDKNTLRLLEDRDPVFLERLFNEVNPYLVRVCLANGLRGEDVNEIVHQTWEKFFSNLSLFEGRSQIRTFICGILFNKIREHRRRQARVIYEEDSTRFMDNAFTEEGWWKISPSDPYRLAELKQSAGFVKECLEGLSEQQVTAFVMKEVNDDASDEICQVMGVNVSHLRVLIFRAKDKLRKCLEGKIGEGAVLR